MRFHVMLVLPRVPLPFFLGRPPLFFFGGAGCEAFAVISYYFKLRQKTDTVFTVQLVLGRVDVQEGVFGPPRVFAHPTKQLPRDIPGHLFIYRIFLGPVLGPNEIGREVGFRCV